MSVSEDSLLQNDIVNFPQLVLMANMYPIPLIKFFLFFLTSLVAFSFCLKPAWFIDCGLYTPRVYLVNVKVKLIVTYFSLWTSYNFVI